MPHPMRLPNWYPRQRRFLRCGNPPTVPSGGANAANVVVRRANAREPTPLEMDRRQRRSRSLGAAAEIVPNRRYLPSPSVPPLRRLRPGWSDLRTILLRFSGWRLVHGSFYRAGRGANGEDGSRSQPHPPAGPNHAQHPTFEWRARFRRREHLPFQARLEASIRTHGAQRPGTRG
jgi:hypothetical protein